MRKAIQVMFSTYVASRCVMFERSSLLPNIEALYINSPVSPVIAEENAHQLCLFLCTFLFTKIYSRRGVFNAYLQTLLLNFTP